jgi:hypothetical protein
MFSCKQRFSFLGGGGGGGNFNHFYKKNKKQPVPKKIIFLKAKKFQILKK